MRLPWKVSVEALLLQKVDSPLLPPSTSFHQPLALLPSVFLLSIQGRSSLHSIGSYSPLPGLLVSWLSQLWPDLRFATRVICLMNPFGYITSLSKTDFRASLVVQWLRICLPMQGTRVRALVWEDPTFRGATGPVSHNYWACAPGACAPQQERPR